MNPWTVLLCALGVAIFLEGLPYFISPSGVRRYLRKLSTLGDGALRTLGLILMAIGLLVAYVSLH